MNNSCMPNPNAGGAAGTLDKELLTEEEKKAKLLQEKVSMLDSEVMMIFTMDKSPG